MRLRNTKHYRKRTVTEMHCEISYKSEFLHNNFYQFPDFQLMTTNVAPPTINELLNDLLNKLDKPATINTNNNNTQEDTTPILNNILNTINTNDNKLNDFIKEHQLKNKIIINKLDNILKATTEHQYK